MANSKNGNVCTIGSVAVWLVLTLNRKTANRGAVARPMLGSLGKQIRPNQLLKARAETY